MEINKIPMLIVGVVVALVLAGSTLPVFAETTTATNTFANTGYYQMIDTHNDDYVLSWDYTNPTKFNANGDEIDLTNLSMARDYTIFGSSDFLVRYVYRSDGLGYGINAFLGPSGSISSTVGQELNFTLTYTAETKTVSVTGSTTATQILNNEVYGIAKNGNYVMKISDEPVYILGTSPIVGIGRTSLAGGVINTWVSAIGGIDNGIDVSFFNSTPEGTTAGDVTISKESVDNFKNLYTVTNFKFPITYDGTTATATYAYFIVPAEIVAEKTVHPDGALTVMLGILPLLIIAGLVAGSVAWFITRK